MSKFTCLVVCFVAVSFGAVNAVTEEEKAAFREAIKPFTTECGKEHGVTEDEIQAAKKAGTMDTIESCFFACVYKKIGFLNEKGLFDTEAAMTKVKKYVNSAEWPKFEEVGKKCLSVNEESVSDGEAGCERAKMLLKCFLSFKNELFL